MQSKEYSLELEGRKEIKVTIGELATRTNSSVLAQMGETVVLVTCVMGKKGREDIDYLPLTVDYEERFYAAGKIKGSRFVKREGRPSDEAILTSRLIDRALRPLFDQRIRNPIQVISTVLSFDGTNDPDTLSLIAASLALSISDIPWSGPVACVRISDIDGKFVVDPTYEERGQSSFNVLVAGIDDKVNMLESRARQVPEEKILDAIESSQPYIRKIINWQKQIQQEIGRKKTTPHIQEPSPEIRKLVLSFAKDKLEQVVYSQDQVHLGERIATLKEEILDHLKSEAKIELDENTGKEIDLILDEEIDKMVGRNILENERRPDGRKLDEVRKLSCRVGILPRTHGSGLFSRGTTQALSIVTLAGPGAKQILDTMEETDTFKHFMHHYSFPPFCTGEIKPLRGPGRREIGHGALAEKALEEIIPDKDEFPYTIRVVSEILAANGSSSMASVCASSLALMDAGVPIKKPASGIAMGLILDEKTGNFKILTDIQGPEDHHGNMDLKIAGTRDGVTAMQMDVKAEGLTLEILKAAFGQAKKARLEILSEMEKAISEPRKELSPYAPLITIMQINPDRIRDVIGPGGKVINEIIAETGVEIDIEDSGMVFITSTDKVANEKATAWIKNLTHEVQAGEIFQGRVTRLLDFGAMVEILPNQEGLVHISELAPYRVNKVSDIVKIGDVVPVKVKNIDDLGRINLSLKDAKNSNSHK